MPRLTSFRRSSSSSSSIDDSTLDGPPCAVEVRGAGSSMADGTYLLTTNEMDGAPVYERDRGAWRLLRMHLPSGTHWLVVTRGGTWYRCRSELPTPPCGRGVRWETGTDGARPVPTFTAVLRNAGLTRSEMEDGYQEAQAKDRAVATAVLATLSLGASAALRVQKETAGFFSRLLPSGERCKLGINLYALGRVSDT